jgi:acetyltransferase-like isoleucine patch superfamily enzyme
LQNKSSRVSAKVEQSRILFGSDPAPSASPRHDRNTRITRCCVEPNLGEHAGATILGRIVIGQRSTIGGNVGLTEDVPPNSFVTQASVRSKVTSG